MHALVLAEWEEVEVKALTFPQSLLSPWPFVQKAKMSQGKYLEPPSSHVEPLNQDDVCHALDSI